MQISDSDALVSAEQIRDINPLDWEEAFPAVVQEGGFDAIVGNPPYIRLQPPLFLLTKLITEKS